MTRRIRAQRPPLSSLAAALPRRIMISAGSGYRKSLMRRFAYAAACKSARYENSFGPDNPRVNKSRIKSGREPATLCHRLKLNRELWWRHASRPAFAGSLGSGDYVAEGSNAYQFDLRVWSLVKSLKHRSMNRCEVDARSGKSVKSL